MQTLVCGRMVLLLVVVRTRAVACELKLHAARLRVSSTFRFQVCWRIVSVRTGLALLRCVIQFVHLLELNPAEVRCLTGQVSGIPRRVPLISVELLRALRVVQQVILAVVMFVGMAETILLVGHVAPPARLLGVHFTSASMCG